MAFGHEEPDVYRISIRSVSWAYEVAGGLKGVDRHARDQLLRASQSIPLDLSEGAPKAMARGRMPIGAVSLRLLAVRRWNAQRFKTALNPAER
jgi:hypothetical protein